jgi:hypothetical protein
MSADRLNGGGGDSDRVGDGKIGISAPCTGDSIQGRHSMSPNTVHLAAPAE